MPTPAIRFDGHSVDLSGRFFENHTVAASPALAAETVICTMTVGEDVAVTKGVFLLASAAFTVGTSGVSATMKIRQTGTSGTTLWTSGATTVTAANLWEMGGQALDASPALPGQVYVVTLTVGSGSAASTVSAVSLIAVVI